MALFEELRNVRLEKLKLLEKEGINPYPSKTIRDYTLMQVIDNFDKLVAEKNIHLTGRIMAIRGQGALVFISLNDGTATFQGLLKKDEMA